MIRGWSRQVLICNSWDIVNCPNISRKIKNGISGDFGTNSQELGALFTSHLQRKGCLLVVSGSYRAKLETICGLFTFTPNIVIIDVLYAGNIQVIYLLQVISR